MGKLTSFEEGLYKLFDSSSGIAIMLLIMAK